MDITCCAKSWIFIISVHAIRCSIAQILDWNTSSVKRTSEWFECLTFCFWKLWEMFWGIVCCKKKKCQSEIQEWKWKMIACEYPFNLFFQFVLSKYWWKIMSTLCWHAKNCYFNLFDLWLFWGCIIFLHIHEMLLS